MDFSLNEAEQAAAEKFLRKRDVKSLLKQGGRVSLEFSNSSGIGRSLRIVVRIRPCEVDEVLLSKDITDYTVW